MTKIRAPEFFEVKTAFGGSTAMDAEPKATFSTSRPNVPVGRLLKFSKKTHRSHHVRRTHAKPSRRGQAKAVRKPGRDLRRPAEQARRQSGGTARICLCHRRTRSVCYPMADFTFREDNSSGRQDGARVYSRSTEAQGSLPAAFALEYENGLDLRG